MTSSRNCTASICAWDTKNCDWKCRSNLWNSFNSMRKPHSWVLDHLKSSVCHEMSCAFHNFLFRLARDYSKLFEVIFFMISLYIMCATCSLMLLMRIQLVRRGNSFVQKQKFTNGIRPILHRKYNGNCNFNFIFSGILRIPLSDQVWFTQQFSSIIQFLFWIQFQEQRNVNDSAGILLTFAFLFASYVCIFVLCEFGERVMAVFEEVSIAIDQLRFYLFPIDTQKMLPTVLVVAQDGVKLSMFGSIDCNRRTFKEVKRLESFIALESKIVHFFSTISRSHFCSRFFISHIRRSWYLNDKSSSHFNQGNDIDLQWVSIIHTYLVKCTNDRFSA